MARHKRRFNVFSLSFLDIMSCGFGAVVLFFMIINHSTKEYNAEVNKDLISEVNLLERQVEIGEDNRFKLKNAIRQTEDQQRTLEGLSARIIEGLEVRREELAELDKDTLAQRESINLLKTDLQSLDEKNRRLEGARDQGTDRGEELRNIVGAGNRLYLTGLQLGGDRTLFLIDASASMLDDTIVNIIRLRNMSDSNKRRARKWQRAVGSTEWLIANLPEDGKFQVLTFNTVAEPVLGGNRRDWLEASNPDAVNKAVTALRTIVPGRGTSLHRAFEAASQMSPPPSTIFLLTDGLPTMGRNPPASKKVSGRRRMRHFNSSLKELPKGIPVNIILFPMEGDPRASSAFWRLAQITGGSYLSPASDWP